MQCTQSAVAAPAGRPVRHAPAVAGAALRGRVHRVAPASLSLGCSLRLSRSRVASVVVAAQPGDDVPEGYGDSFPEPNPPRRAGVLLHPTSLPVRTSSVLTPPP